MIQGGASAQRKNGAPSGSTVGAPAAAAPEGRRVEGQLLAEVEAGGQLRHRHLAPGHLSRRGRGAQPGGYGLQALARGGDLQEVQQGAGASEVEVAGVRVLGARGRGVTQGHVLPAPLQAGQGLLVERLGPRGLHPAPVDPTVEGDEGEEEGEQQRRQGPQGRPRAPDGGAQRGHGGDEGQQAQVGQEVAPAGQGRPLRAARSRRVRYASAGPASA